MNKLRIGILGAKGFVGKALVEQFLLEKNFLELHLYSRTQNEKTKIKNVFVHQFDLNEDCTTLHPSLLEIDVLYYLISESIPSSSWDFPSKEIQNNLIPFMKLIEQLKNGNIKKIIFTSSAGTIYGPSDKKITEEGIKKPFSPHGITKLTTEYFLEYLKIKYNIQYDIFRISNIYGPGQDISKGLGLINTLLEKKLRNEEIIIYGDGTNTRNYIYIDDVVKTLNQSINNNLNSSNTVNLASSYHFTINEIIAIIEMVTNTKLNFTKVAPRNSDNSIIMIDNTKLKDSFPQFKETNIETGINETLNYLRKIK
jgi:UDP-glucose 4-epimerase